MILTFLFPVPHMGFQSLPVVDLCSLLSQMHSLALLPHMPLLIQPLSHLVVVPVNRLHLVYPDQHFPHLFVLLISLKCCLNYTD